MVVSATPHQAHNKGRYERRVDPVLPPREYRRRIVEHVALSAILLSVSLGLGVVGFHAFAGQEWVDAILNSAMLLGGMGPVGEFRSVAGKLFAAAYALYAGLVFLGAAAFIVAPVLHRAAHRFHFEERSGEADGKP